MDKFVPQIKWFFGSLLSGLAYLLGGWDMSLQILATLMIMDLVVGMVVGFENKNLCPDIALKGSIKKVMMLCSLIIAVMLDRITGDKEIFRTTLSYYFIGTEGLSVIRNISLTGVTLPPFIEDALKKMTEPGGR